MKFIHSIMVSFTLIDLFRSLTNSHSVATNFLLQSLQVPRTETSSSSFHFLPWPNHLLLQMLEVSLIILKKSQQTPLVLLHHIILVQRFRLNFKTTTTSCGFNKLNESFSLKECTRLWWIVRFHRNSNQNKIELKVECLKNTNLGLCRIMLCLTGFNLPLLNQCYLECYHGSMSFKYGTRFTIILMLIWKHELGSFMLSWSPWRKTPNSSLSMCFEWRPLQIHFYLLDIQSQRKTRLIPFLMVY